MPQSSDDVPGVAVNYRLRGQTDLGFFEDFSAASGIQPPIGWISAFIRRNRLKLDGWRWENPSRRGLNLPISAPFSIFDSEHRRYQCGCFDRSPLTRNHPAHPIQPLDRHSFSTLSGSSTREVSSVRHVREHRCGLILRWQQLRQSTQPGRRAQSASRRDSP